MSQLNAACDAGRQTDNSLTMNHDGADTWATRIEIVALFVVLGFVGFLTDMFSGLPLT